MEGGGGVFCGGRGGFGGGRGGGGGGWGGGGGLGGLGGGGVGGRWSVGRLVGSHEDWPQAAQGHPPDQSSGEGQAPRADRADRSRDHGGDLRHAAGRR